MGCSVYFKWQSEVLQRVHFITSVVADDKDVQEDSDADDEENAMQVESV